MCRAEPPVQSIVAASTRSRGHSETRRRRYQLPDATTEGGVATILEATFVQACMQLSTGYVDTLKYFIAAATSARATRAETSLVGGGLERRP